MRVASALAGFIARRGRPAAQGDGQEERRRSCRPSARSSSRARPAAASARRRPREIFDLMEHFAGYGFNKSHSTTYALLAYQTAYLKANYPWHFMAALLTIESQNTDKLAIVPPRVPRAAASRSCRPTSTAASWPFTVRPEGVRFGLGAVKNVGEGAIASILQARDGARPRDRRCIQLCEDVDLRLVNKRVLESLVKAGALDRWSRRRGRAGGVRALRPRLLAALDGAVEHGNRTSAIATRGRRELFGGGDDGDACARGCAARRRAAVDRGAAAGLREGGARPVSERPPDRSVRRRPRGLRREEPRGPAGGPQEAPEAAAGLTTTRPPWAAGRPSDGRARTCRSAASSRRMRQLKTKKGDRMAAFVLDDPHGTVEVVVFPEAFSQGRPRCCRPTPLVLVRGQVRAGRGLDADAGVRDPADRRRCRSSWRREVLVAAAMPPPRPAGRSRRVSDVLGRHRGDRRVVVRSSTARRRRRRCACGSTCRARCASARRSSSWPTSSGSAGRDGHSAVGSGRLRRSMAAELLEFEEPIGILLKEIEALSLMPRTEARSRRHRAPPRARRRRMRAELFEALTPWQRVLVARHRRGRARSTTSSGCSPTSSRSTATGASPTTRRSSAGSRAFHGEPVLVVGHQKGRTTKEKIARNFGYARPEGYRKALRAMRMAEKFNRPIIVFVDTPAAYPGIESEERGVAEAIALNLREMAVLDVPDRRRGQRRGRQRRRARHRRSATAC